MKYAILLAFCALAVIKTVGQSIGDFRSHQTGDWSEVASWDQWNGIEWVYPPISGPEHTLGDVTIRNGHTITVSESVTMRRTLSVLGTLVSDGITTFEGASSITGPGNKLFNTIVVRAGDSLASSASVTVRGDLVVDGAIRFSAGILVFAGDSSIVSGTSANAEFYAVRVDSGALVTTTIPLALYGNLTVSESGRFVAVSGGDLTCHGNVSVTGTFGSDARVTFPDTTTLTGVGIKSFRHIQITGTLIPNGAYTISEMFTLTGSGTLQAGNSTTTFAGNVSMLNAGTGTVTFNNFAIPLNTPAFSFTTAADVAILGATLRCNNGILNCSGKTLFVRAGTTRLIGTGSARFTSFTVGISTTFRPNIPLTITSNITLDGSMVATNAVTFAGTSSLLTVGTPVITFNHLTIGVNSSLTAWPGLITVNGNFTNSGTFHHRGGTVAFGGAMSKKITGLSTTEFENLTIQNGTAEPDVSVEGSIVLEGILMLTPGAHFDADGAADTSVFFLRSSGDNPTADACIGSLPDGAEVLGNVTVQRYVALEGGNNHRIYRYVSSPVFNATVSDLQNEIPVTGAFIGSSGCAGCGRQPSMFWYDESVVTGGVGDGYVPFPTVSNSEVLVPGKGYAVFVRGNINPVLASGASSFDLRGPINSGTVDYQVTYNSSGLPDNDGWNLVGNPYPAPINWDAAEGWTKTNVAGATYRMDNGVVPSRYAVWNGTVGINGGTAILAEGQGFFVQTTEGQPVLRSDERVKDTGATSAFVRTAAPTQFLRIGLLQGTRKDETIVHFREGGSEAFDIRCDARKLKNLLDGNGDTPFLNLSSLATPDSLRLAINSLPGTIHEAIVRLDVSDVPVGSYRLEFSNMESFAVETLITLTDKFFIPHRAVDVRQTGSYTFEVTNDSLSFGAGRFAVCFSNPRTVTGGSRNSPEIKLYPNPVSGVFFAEIEDEANELTSLRIVNNGGEEIGKLTTIRKGKDVLGQFDFTSSPCGIYFLEVVRGRNRRWEKIIRK